MKVAKTIFSIWLMIVLIMGNIGNVFAQKAKGKKNAPKEVVSDETRKQSALFADGLKEFYAEDFTTAENTFRKIISANEKNDAAFFMLARIYKNKKSYSEAIIFLKEALKIDKSNIWYKVELAEVYDLMNDYKNSTKLWEEICKLKPENEFYLFTLSDNYIKMGEYAKVISAYDKLEVLEGYNDEITNAKVNIWLYLNDVKNAIGEYDKLIKEFPSEPRYYVYAGNICQSNNLPEKAKEYYQKALQIDPNNTLANMAMAEYYANSGNETAAFDAIAKAFSDPNIEMEIKLPFLKSYFNKAIKTPNKETVTKCTELAQIITQTHPNQVEGWAILASMDMVAKKHSEARKNFEQALSIDQSSYPLWEDYFFCLSQLKDYKSMITKGKEVLEIFPTNAEMLYNIANAHYLEKEYSQAIELLRQAATYSYDNNLLANIYNVLGDCHKELGNSEEAVKNWKIALKKGINTQDKIDAAQDK